MIRVKSAPSNLCEMKNNKKVTISSTANKIFYLPNTNTNTNTNIKILKKSKLYLSKIGNFCSDLINDSNILSLEDSLLISGIISYFSDNILKKDKLKEIVNFTILSFVKYIILYYVHTEILHDKINNNIYYISHFIK
tara:strand:+ start:439 stop:849 length:411 start_codon:yes stop_codon:yes gene_type:complete